MDTRVQSGLRRSVLNSLEYMFQYVRMDTRVQSGLRLIYTLLIERIVMLSEWIPAFRAD